MSNVAYYFDGERSGVFTIKAKNIGDANLSIMYKSAFTIVKNKLNHI